MSVTSKFHKQVLVSSLNHNFLYQSANIIKKCLHRRNTKKVRIAAFEVLLDLLLDVFPQQEVDDSHIATSNSTPPSVLRSMTISGSNYAPNIQEGDKERNEKFLLHLFGSAVDMRPFPATPNSNVAVPLSDGKPVAEA